MARTSSQPPDVSEQKTKFIRIEPAFPDRMAVKGAARASSATARVRDALVLRAVPKNAPVSQKPSDEQRLG
jgi:hypothetical protein